MAAERWAYAVLGRGRWASKITSILEAGQRAIRSVADIRRAPKESRHDYIARLEAALRASGAQAAWLCVPPGPHVVAMMRAAIAAGLHVIAEKPWMYSAEETHRLAQEAAANRLQIGVHFEYCLLDEMESWRERYRGGRGLHFGGRFMVSRPHQSRLPALENLGCHLFAMRRYAVPQSKIDQLVCAYGKRDERQVWVESALVDFLCSRQPVIQRFIRKFEAAAEGAAFPLGVEFAAGVAEDLLTWRGRQTMESLRR